MVIVAGLHLEFYGGKSMSEHEVDTLICGRAVQIGIVHPVVGPLAIHEVVLGRYCSRHSEALYCQPVCPIFTQSLD